MGMFESYFPGGVPVADGINNFAPKAAFDVVMDDPKFTMIMLNTTPDDLAMVKDELNLPVDSLI